MVVLILLLKCKSAGLLQLPPGEDVVGWTLPEGLPVLQQAVSPPPVLPVLPLVEIKDGGQVPPLPVPLLVVKLLTPHTPPGLREEEAGPGGPGGPLHGQHYSRMVSTLAKFPRVVSPDCRLTLTASFPLGVCSFPM